MQKEGYSEIEWKDRKLSVLQDDDESNFLSTSVVFESAFSEHSKH